MKTKIRKFGEDVVIVDMEGFLSFEEHEPLRHKLIELKRGSAAVAPKKIIFNLEKLEFVGSSGISSFVQALKEFNSGASVRPRYCNVRSEFKRIFKAFDEENIFEFYDSEERAKKSFDN